MGGVADEVHNRRKTKRNDTNGASKAQEALHVGFLGARARPLAAMRKSHDIIYQNLRKN